MAVLHASGIVQILATDTVSTTFDLTLGFQMKAMRFWWMGRAGTSDGVGRGTIRYGHGFATGTADRRCVGSKVVDAGAASDGGCVKRTDAVVATCDNAATPALDGAIDINSVSSTQVQLIVDDQLPADLTICWEAWGGDSITNAITIEETLNSIVADSVINATGVGFQGTVAFLAAFDAVTLGNVAISDRYGICFGAFTGTGDEHLIQYYGDDGSANMDTWSYALAGECLAYGPAAGGAGQIGRCSFNAWTSDGFDLNIIENDRNNRRFIALVIQGGSWAIGSLTSNTSVTTQAISGLGFAPAGVSFQSVYKAAHTADTGTTNGTCSVGVATRDGGQFVQALMDEDATANAECTVALDTDKVYAAIDTASAIEGLASVSAWGSDGFTWSQDDADPTGRFVWYVACGPIAAGAPPYHGLLEHRRYRPLVVHPY